MENLPSEMKRLKFIFSRQYFLHHDSWKLQRYIQKVSSIHNESDALNFFQEKTTFISVHHLNNHPIDRIDFLLSIPLFNELLTSLTDQLVAASKFNNAPLIASLELSLSDLIRNFTWMQLIGKSRWIEREMETSDLNCLFEQVADILTVTCHPKVVFEIYKAIPINDYELPSRNRFIAALSYFSSNRNLMREDLLSIIGDVLQGNTKPVEHILSDENIKAYSGLQVQEQLQSHLIDKNITPDNLFLVKTIINLIKISLNFEESATTSERFKDQLDCKLLDMVSLLTQVYCGDKLKFYDQQSSIRGLKVSAEGPFELFNLLKQIIIDHSNSDDHMQYFLDFLVCMEYQALFSSDMFSEHHVRSSLFYHLEKHFFDSLEEIDLHLRSNGEVPLQLGLSRVALRSKMNMKDILEVSIQQIETLEYLTRVFDQIAFSEKDRLQVEGIQRQQLVELIKKTCEIHKEIILSFTKKQWVYDPAVLEIYLEYAEHTFTEADRFDIKTKLSIKLIDMIKVYLDNETLPTQKGQTVEIDQFSFVLKSYMSLVSQFNDEDTFEEYLNDLFFNVEMLADKCLKTPQKASKIRCILMNICFKFCNIDQLEDYFNPHFDEKLARFEAVLDLFLASSCRVDVYFENFITACTKKVDMSRYLRMLSKYAFARIFPENPIQIQHNIQGQDQLDTVVDVIAQLLLQYRVNIASESLFLKQSIQNSSLMTSLPPKKYQFLITKFLLYINQRKNVEYKNILTFTQNLAKASNFNSNQSQSLQKLFKLLFQHQIELSIYPIPNYIIPQLQNMYSFPGILNELTVESEILRVIRLIKQSPKEYARCLINNNQPMIEFQSLKSEEKRNIKKQSMYLISILFYFDTKNDTKEDEELYTVLVDLAITICQELKSIKIGIGRSDTAKHVDFGEKKAKRIIKVVKKSEVVFNRLQSALGQLQKSLILANNQKIIEDKRLDIIRFCLQSVLKNVGQIEEEDYINNEGSQIDGLILFKPLTTTLFSLIGSEASNRVLYSDFYYTWMNFLLKLSPAQNTQFREQAIAAVFSVIQPNLSFEGTQKINNQTFSEAQNFLNAIAFQIIHAEVVQDNKINQYDIVGFLQTLKPIAQIESLLQQRVNANDYHVSGIEYFSRMLGLTAGIIQMKEHRELALKIAFEDMTEIIKDRDEVLGLSNLILTLHLTETNEIISQEQGQIRSLLLESLHYIDGNNCEEDILRLFFVFTTWQLVGEASVENQEAIKIEKTLMKELIEKWEIIDIRTINLVFGSKLFTNSVSNLLAFDFKLAELVRMYKGIKENSGTEKISEKARENLLAILSSSVMFIDEDSLFVFEQILKETTLTDNNYEILFQPLLRVAASLTNLDIIKDSFLSKIAISIQLQPNSIQQVGDCIEYYGLIQTASQYFIFPELYFKELGKLPKKIIFTNEAQREFNNIIIKLNSGVLNFENFALLSKLIIRSNLKAGCQLLNLFPQLVIVLSDFLLIQCELMLVNKDVDFHSLVQFLGRVSLTISHCGEAASKFKDIIQYHLRSESSYNFKQRLNLLQIIFPIDSNEQHSILQSLIASIDFTGHSLWQYQESSNARILIEEANAAIFVYESIKKNPNQGINVFLTTQEFSKSQREYLSDLLSNEELFTSFQESYKQVLSAAPQLTLSEEFQATPLQFDLNQTTNISKMMDHLYIEQEVKQQPEQELVMDDFVNQLKRAITTVAEQTNKQEVKEKVNDCKQTEEDNEEDDWEGIDCDDDNDEKEEDMVDEAYQNPKKAIKQPVVSRMGGESNEDSSDYDHEGEKREVMQDEVQLKEKNEKSSQKVAIEVQDNDEDYEDEDEDEEDEKMEEEGHSKKSNNSNEECERESEIDSEDDSESGNNMSNDDDQDDEEENEEIVKKRAQQWLVLMMLKERWSVAKFSGGDESDSEIEIIKKSINSFLQDLKNENDSASKNSLQDALQQFDDEDIRKFLSVKFPKYSWLKKTKSNLKQKNSYPVKLIVDIKDESQEQACDDNDNEDDDFVEVEESEDEEVQKEQKHHEDEGLLYISSSEEHFEEDDDDEDEENDYLSNISRSVDNEDSENSQSNSEFYTTNHKKQSELEVERNVPESSILVEKYLTRTLFYNEVAIAGVLKQFYLRDFSSSSITSLLYNPISGPQLIDGIFFLLLFPQLDKFAQELLPTNDFLVGLGSKQLFEKNYLMFYENAMNLFKQEILNVTSNYDLLAYFTYDSAHWKYLPQLSFIRRLKEITNFKQISGLQTLLRLYGENFKYENIMDNANHKDIIKEITDFIQTPVCLLKEEQIQTEKVSIKSPLLVSEDILCILHFYYFGSESLTREQFLFRLLKKAIDNSDPSVALDVIRLFVAQQSKNLQRDAIIIINNTINDSKQILVGVDNEAQNKAQVISNLNNNIADTLTNPFCEYFRSFTSNLRVLMRRFFKKIKNLPKPEQDTQLFKLREQLSSDSLMQLFSSIMKQLSFFKTWIFGSSLHAGKQIFANDQNGELQNTISTYIPMVKLMYMLHPYYDMKPYQELEHTDPTLIQEEEGPTCIPLILTKSHSSQINYSFEEQTLNLTRKVESLCDQDGERSLKSTTLLTLEEFTRVLESGFCSMIKMFTGLDDQLFRKYISVVSKNPENLKSLDVDTRVMAISQKAIRRASRIENMEGDTIGLSITRGCVFEDSFRAIMREKPCGLVQKQFEVKFRNEEGIDQSGLTREWYSCISKELFTPRNGLFKVTFKKYLLLPSTTAHLVPDYLSVFKFAGKITAKALLEGYVIGVDLPKFILKQIASSPLLVSDLEDIDPDLAKNMLWILENSAEDLGLTFSYEYEELGVRKTHDLQPNGKMIDVTDANKKEYVRLIMEFIMVKQLSQQVTSFIDGFFEVFPKSEVTLIDWMELGSLIAGSQEINLNELRANTTYQGGYSEISPVISWFWKILGDFDEKMKRKFLFFLSGSYKIPQGGYKDMGFTIFKVFQLQQLPVAHTCFNKLDIPPYEDYDTFKKKLYQAILDGNEGFGIA